MMISTKGRYALRLMIDLAKNCVNGAVPLQVMAERQGVSKKYTEAIMAMLSNAGLVKGTPGAGGGYILTRDPEQYKIGEILQTTEKTLSPVACLMDGAPPCERESFCTTLPLWKGLNKVISDYLNSVTLFDLVENKLKA